MREGSMANRVLPSVRLFFPCDSATLDPSDNKWVLRNPRHTVSVPSGVAFPVRVKEIYLYAQLTDGVGAFQLSVQLRRAGSDVILGRSPPSPTIEFVGGLQVVEEVFHLIKIPFPRADLYEFKLLANHTELEGGTACLRVV
jgi:hypothetical protein